MTRGGFILALVFFGACVVVGAVGAAPTPSQLGWLTERTCAEWMAEPEEGAFRLTDCEVSLVDIDAGDSRAIVQPAGTHAREEEPPARLTWDPDEGRLEELAERLHREAYTWEVRRRTAERFEDELVQRRELSGRIESVGSGWKIGPDEPHAFFRAFALVVLGFGLLGLLLLVPAQRRWDRRARELGAQGTRPVRF